MELDKLIIVGSKNCKLHLLNFHKEKVCCVSKVISVECLDYHCHCQSFLICRVLMFVTLCCDSVFGHSTSAVQAGSWLCHMGIQAHDAKRVRHWSQHTVSDAAEHGGKWCSCTELLSDILHRYLAAHLLCCHRQFTHCWYVVLLACVTLMTCITNFCLVHIMLFRSQIPSSVTRKIYLRAQ